MSTFLALYPYPKTGGAFKQLTRAVSALIEAGHTVHYISSNIAPFERSPQFIYHRFLLYFENELIHNFLFYLLSPWQILFVTVRIKCDRILLFNEEFAALSALSRLLTNTKIMLVIEGFIKSLAESKKLNPVIAKIFFAYGKIGINIADDVYAVSEDLCRKLKYFYGTKKDIKLLRNYLIMSEIKKAKKIPMKREAGLREDVFLFGCVAQLSPRKNIGYLINEISLLNKNDRAHFLIVGSGQEKDGLTEQVKRLGLERAVTFLGERTDSLNIIKSLDLLVLPSLHDDCPLVLIEALNLDTPCIASKVGGIPETLKYDELMFDPGKAGDLSDKLERFIEDAKYRDLLGNLCAQRKKEFDKDWGEEIVKLLG